MGETVLQSRYSFCERIWQAATAQMRSPLLTLTQMLQLQPLDPIGYRDHFGKFRVTKVADDIQAIQYWGVITEEGFPLDWDQVLPPF